MKTFVFIFLIGISLTGYARNETIPEDSISAQNLLRQSNLRNEQLNNYLDMEQTPTLPINKYNPQLPAITEQSSKLTYQPIPAIATYHHYPTINVSPTNRYLPMENDYNLSAAYPVGDNIWIGTNSSSVGYIGLGGARTVNAHFGYQPTDWLTVSAGPYASKYAINNSLYKDFGVNGAFNIKAGDRIRFNVYGQYSGNGSKVGGPMSPMFEQSYYGGTVEFKINDNFGIEAGMIREFNPFSGKWENQPIISPVFYGGKKKKK